jgi:1-acyl-sn-glycerol-3-phosphate acyltransferase
MGRLLQRAFFALVVRPLVLVVIGLHVRHRDRLPLAGPAIIVANHNSHLDTVVLMALFPARQLSRVRPVAAADYFLANPLLAWFAVTIMGIIPIARARQSGTDPFAAVSHALGAGDVVLLFPEGTRGEPERLGTLKRGFAHLAARHPGVPVIPVFLHGLGKALPKGALVPLPVFCDVFVGEPLYRGAPEDRLGIRTHHDDHIGRTRFVEQVSARMTALACEVALAPWD